MDFFLLFLPLPVAFLLDALLGDPPFPYHPVRLIGRAIERFEKELRRVFPADPKGERAAGTVLAVTLPLLFAALVGVVLLVAWLNLPPLYFVLDTMLCYQLLAMRDLRVESMAVHERLTAGDLPGARKAVARIVGRDTDTLDEAGVARAAVETVAENASDGVVAPMLFMALGGGALAIWYKAVNTLDSMVGYKNDRYLNFGRASAKLDDFANYLPARLAAWFMLLASETIGLDRRRAARVYRRDRRNHTSPNSAHTESVCAGALGVQLGGNTSYFGKVTEKPTIGDDTRPIEAADIDRANRLMTFTACICLIVCCVVRCLTLLLAQRFLGLYF